MQKTFWIFLVNIWVRIEPLYDRTITAGLKLMCPSFLELNYDNFPLSFFGSSVGQKWEWVCFKNQQVSWIQTAADRKMLWRVALLPAAAAAAQICETRNSKVDITMEHPSTQASLLDVLVHIWVIWIMIFLNSQLMNFALNLPTEFHHGPWYR